MFLFAVLAFLMSISWISFTSDVVIDLLEILGYILQVEPAVLGLTLLAWGNCLGDLNANVAMTKKGFGEMAVTGCMAGPIFNILMGLGVTFVFALINETGDDAVTAIPWSAFDAEGNVKTENVTPLVLVVGLLITNLGTLVNAQSNKFWLNFRGLIPNLVIYALILVTLVSFVFLKPKN